MPLSPKQRKAAQAGYAACLACGEKAAALRRMGRPNEALEERQRANQLMYEEAFKIMAEFDQQRGGKNSGTQ